MQPVGFSYCVRRALLRAQRRIGWSGVAGAVALIAAALLWARIASRPVVTASESRVAQELSASATTTSHEAVALTLPSSSDAALLVNRIRRTAEAHGLGWPRAEYRQQAATDDTPASVEVHCALKGTYPQIRAFLTEVLLDSPSTSVRGLSMARTASEVAEVEAKLVLTTYLREGRP